MATSGYLLGRKRFGRPQGVIWSNNSGVLSNGLLVPDGIEVEVRVAVVDKLERGFVFKASVGKDDLDLVLARHGVKNLLCHVCRGAPTTEGNHKFFHCICLVNLLMSALTFSACGLVR